MFVVSLIDIVTGYLEKSLPEGHTDISLRIITVHLSQNKAGLKL